VIDEMLAVAYDLSDAQWRDVREYTRELENKVVRVIGAAMKRGEPAELRAAEGRGIRPRPRSSWPAAVAMRTRIRGARSTTASRPGGRGCGILSGDVDLPFYVPESWSTIGVLPRADGRCARGRSAIFVLNVTSSGIPASLRRPPPRRRRPAPRRSDSHPCDRPRARIPRSPGPRPRLSVMRSPRGAFLTWWGITSETTVWPAGTEPLRPRAYRGRGRPPKLLRCSKSRRPASIAALAESLPASAWQPITWRQGSRGAMRSRFAFLRLRPAHRDELRAHPREVEWLIIEWPRGESGPTKCWLSTLPADTPRDQRKTSRS